MNRIPCCCRCKSNYHIFGDSYGQRIPMLLNCGHDMCKNCLKASFKRNKQVICEICQADTMINCEDDMLNVPIHFYLVGKVFILSSNKQKKDIFRDINNLKMRNVNTEPLFNNTRYCDLCYKYAKFGCHQCNEVYCENCSEKIHKANFMMADHELETLHIMYPKYPVESNCDQHCKLKDFICVTCDLLTCAVCAIEDHREHDIQHLKKYNMSKVQCLNKYILKGDMLLKKLKHYRNNFREHMQQYQIAHSQKNNKNYDIKKRDVSMFISSIIGALQSLEYKFIYMLDEADQVYNNSMNKVINQLNNLIEDLQEKLNQIDSMSTNSQYSCINMSSDAIPDIEHILDMTYYIAKKKRIETPIIFNQNIFEAVNQCIISEIDISDTYILTNSPELPLNYTLTSTIQLRNDALPERRLSSVSSIDSTNSSSVSAPSTDVDIPSEFRNLSIREIMHNVKEYVIITHQNSPSDFYVQLLANSKIIGSIANEIDKFILTAQSIVKFIEIDNVIYAIQARNGRWYRGHVVNMVNNEDSSHYLYTVYCIDYGFTEILTADRIKRIPECVASIPPLAYNCALYDLKPSIISGWSKNAYQLFTELILNTTGTYYIYPMDTNSEPIQVDVVWKEYMYPLSIRDAMFFLGHGSSAEKFINKELHDELINLISLPSNIQLKEGEEYAVLVNHLITPYEFYFRIMDNEYINLLEETMRALQSIYKPTEVNSHKSYLLYTPQIGMIVAARYSIDSNWYRAKIISLPEPCMVTVDFIDFGNSETLPWNQLRVLEKSLTKQPALAIRASLIDIEPAVDGVECDKWSIEACSEFVKLLMTTYVHENLTAFIQEVDSNSHKVVLYSRTPRGEVCINSHLLSLGHATTSDPSKCVFNKRNKRGDIQNLPINSRDKKVLCTSEDTLSFLKQRSGEKIYHSWIFNDKRKIPKVPMTVINVVSPDHITLKYSDYNFAELTEKMNKAYANVQKNLKKSVWKENDICAVFINKFGNWYRGKIIKLDTKNTSTIYLYDLDETYDQIPLKQLFVLLSTFVTEKCGILHCGMNNIVPLGVSDGKWSKFSCDRLIEEIARYNNIVFLQNTCKRDNKFYGELWAKDVNTPQALESLNERWINLNKFMIEQGYALDYRKSQKDDESTTTESEQEFNENFEIVEHNPSDNSWLAPFPINTPKFNAMVSYVDYHGLIYFHCTDDDTLELLQKVEKEVNFIFKNSKPEPLNFKWRIGQMVIIKYHLDELWYRGIIIDIKENGIFSVQFTDYGNIEDVSHENLRSTLSSLLSNVTDIPQLCVKGFLNKIIPVTKNQKWSTSTLDFLHALVVEKHCVMTVDLEKSNNNIYSIEYLITDCGFDICQYMVDENQAFFSYVDKSKLKFDDYSDDTTFNSDEDCSYSTQSCYSNDIDHDLTNNRMQNVKQEKNDNKYKSNSSGSLDIDMTNEEEIGFTTFSLESNNEIEAQFCTSIGPTRMTFVITKVGGVSMLESKEEMHKLMFKKCVSLPALTQFTPGTAVVVLMPLLCNAWRRGLIVDGGDYIFLVDMGKSIRLIKENVKLCPNEFLLIPMLSIDCHLANVQISENADSENVMEIMSELLFGINLKIVGVDNLDDDVVGVEVYNHNGKIAYQPLIDNKLLIPKN